MVWDSSVLGSWANGRDCIPPHGLASVSFFFLFVSDHTRWRGVQTSLGRERVQSGGGRTWVQVFCNGGVQTLLAMAYIRAQRHAKRGGDAPMQFVEDGEEGREKRNGLNWGTALMAAHLAAYSCAAGDTWASELGILSRSNPRLSIAPWRTVPRGTNGGISAAGTMASALGGASIGLGHALYDACAFGVHAQTIQNTVVFASMSGLVGSMIDSVLGALFQYSGKIVSKEGIVRIVTSPTIKGNVHITGTNVLSNNQVNVLSILLTSLIGIASSRYFFKHNFTNYKNNNTTHKEAKDRIQ